LRMHLRCANSSSIFLRSRRDTRPSQDRSISRAMSRHTTLSANFDVAGAEVPSVSLFDPIGLHGAQQALWVQAVDVPHERWMDRIAYQLTDALGQLVRDLGRHGKAQVLKLSHPADAE